ncbi:MAG: hypothetical protein U1D97_12355 [Desulfuromonadales bacterium]|nr:hypothetical protein [Desulfuromonadales bacterium]
MTLTCIHCYASQSIEAMIESESGRAYARLLLSQPPALQRGLAAYVWMFKPAKRKITYERCLKLANEVLALGADPRALAAALSDTVESLRQKREAGDVRPLTGHNYLRRVLENVPLLAGETLPALPQRRASRTALTDQMLDAWAGDDTLRLQIAHGLRALLALPLTLKPEADAIDRTASLWERQLRRAGLVDTPEELERLSRAFSGLVSSVKDKFPEPSAVLVYLPARKEQPRIAPVVPVDSFDPATAEKIAAFREGL